MEKDLKKRLKEFYESNSHYGANNYSILIGQYGTDGHEVKDPTRFMVMYEGQLKKIVSMTPLLSLIGDRFPSLASQVIIRSVRL